MLRLYPRWNRRRFLQGGGLLGLLGALPGGRRLAAAVAARSRENSANVYTPVSGCGPSSTPRAPKRT